MSALVSRFWRSTSPSVSPPPPPPPVATNPPLPQPASPPSSPPPPHSLPPLAAESAASLHPAAHAPPTPTSPPPPTRAAAPSLSDKPPRSLFRARRSRAPRVAPASLTSLHPPASHPPLPPASPPATPGPLPASPPPVSTPNASASPPSNAPVSPNSTRSPAYPVDFPATRFNLLKSPLSAVLNGFHRREVAAVLRATSRSSAPAPPSAVAEVIAALSRGGHTDDRASPVGAVLACLKARLRSENVVVALKAEILLHAVCRGANSAFVRFLRYCDDVLEGVGGAAARKYDLWGVIPYAQYLKAWLRANEASRNYDGQRDVMQEVAHANVVLDVVEAAAMLPWGREVRERQAAPAVAMVLHDQRERWWPAIDNSMTRLHAAFLNLLSVAEVHVVLDVYARCVEVCTTSARAMRSIDARVADDNDTTAWQVPRGGEAAATAELHRMHVAATDVGWRAALARATDAADARPPADDDVRRVVAAAIVACISELTSQEGAEEEAEGYIEGRVLVSTALCAQLGSADWRTVMKAQLVTRAMLERERAATVAAAAASGDFWVANELDARVPGARKGIPLVQWMSGYLRVRTRAQVAAAASEGEEHATRLVGLLGRAVDVLETFAELPQAAGATWGMDGGGGGEHSRLVEAVYAMAARDLREVFSGAGVRANEVVATFFDTGGGAELLHVYERFAAVAAAARAPGGSFERAWGVGHTAATGIVEDMRAFVRAGGQARGEAGASAGAAVTTGIVEDMRMFAAGERTTRAAARAAASGKEAATVAVAVTRTGTEVVESRVVVKATATAKAAEAAAATEAQAAAAAKAEAAVEAEVQAAAQAAAAAAWGQS